MGRLVRLVFPRILSFFLFVGLILVAWTVGTALAKVGSCASLNPQLIVR